MNKKRIDLTLREIQKIHSQYTYCKECPLRITDDVCLWNKSIGMLNIDWINEEIEVDYTPLEKDNPFCSNCKESDCCVSLDETCAMVREYLKAKKESE